MSPRPLLCASLLAAVAGRAGLAPSVATGLDGGGAPAWTATAHVAAPFAAPVPVLHVLVEPPAERYGGGSLTDADRLGARAAAAHGLEYDPALGHAARELASFLARHPGQLPTARLVAFALDAAGAVTGPIEPWVTATDEPLAEPLQAAMRAVRHRVSGPVRVGAGWASAGSGRLRRQMVVLADAGSPLLTAPVARRIVPAQAIPIRGRLPASASEGWLRVLTTDLALHHLPLASGADGFDVVVPSGDGPGHVQIEIEGLYDGQRRRLARLDLVAGLDLPREHRERPPVVEASIDVATAERILFALINQDRMAHGLDPLTLEPRLSEAARAHSRDMADGGFLDHRSPGFGDLNVRAQRAGYRSVRLAENIARHASVQQAEADLMLSVGHRHNILTPSLREAGVGVAPAFAADGSRTWFITQMFGCPVEAVDGTLESRRLLARINRSRRALGLGAVTADPLMAAVAAHHAVLGAEPRAVLAEASLDGRAYASVLDLWRLDQLELPAAALDPTYARAGVAVRQVDRVGQPSITVVMLLAQ